MTLLVVQVGMTVRSTSAKPRRDRRPRPRRARLRGRAPRLPGLPALLGRHGRPATAGAGAPDADGCRPRRQSTLADSRHRRPPPPAGGRAGDGRPQKAKVDSARCRCLHIRYRNGRLTGPVSFVVASPSVDPTAVVNHRFAHAKIHDPIQKSKKKAAALDRGADARATLPSPYRFSNWLPPRLHVLASGRCL